MSVVERANIGVRISEVGGLGTEKGKCVKVGGWTSVHVVYKEPVPLLGKEGGQYLRVVAFTHAISAE